MIGLSTSIFDISEYYRKRLRRGDRLPVSWQKWDITSQTELQVVPQATPEAWMVYFRELWWYDNTIAFSETTPGNGLIDVSYPIYDGTDLKSFTMNAMNELDLRAIKEVTINSVTYQVMVFDPPVLLFDSKTNKTFEVKKNTNVTGVTSGDLTIIAKDLYTIKETDY